MSVCPLPLAGCRFISERARSIERVLYCRGAEIAFEFDGAGKGVLATVVQIAQ